MPCTGGAVCQLRRNGELTASADLHARDAVLPALDQATKRELNGLATAPGRVELFAGLELDTDVVNVDGATGNGFGAFSDNQILDDQIGRRGGLPGTRLRACYSWVLLVEAKIGGGRG